MVDGATGGGGRGRRRGGGVVPPAGAPATVGRRGRGRRWPASSGARVAEGRSSTPMTTATTTMASPLPARARSGCTGDAPGGWSADPFPPGGDALIAAGAAVRRHPRSVRGGVRAGGGANAGREGGSARVRSHCRRARRAGGSTASVRSRCGCGWRPPSFRAGSTTIARSRESACPCRSMPSCAQPANAHRREARILPRHVPPPCPTSHACHRRTGSRAPRTAVAWSATPVWRSGSAGDL